MIEVHAFTFWGITAMAVIGTLLALANLFVKDKAAEDKSKKWYVPEHRPPGEAPPGYRWVLVKDE